jgi:hypothetical protein
MDLVLSLNIREMKKCMLRCTCLVALTFYFARAFCVSRIATVIQTVRGQNVREFLVINAVQIYKRNSSVILVRLLFSVRNRQVRI